MMLMQDTMSQQRLNQVKLLAWQELIKHQLVKHPVMMPMQDTMFHLLHNLAKRLVLQEHTRLTQVRTPVMMLMLDNKVWASARARATFRFLFCEVTSYCC